MAEDELISPGYGLDIAQVEISWDEVYFTIQGKDKPVEILKGISGTAEPGDFLVIMGSSGAGKTTLLNVLSDRVQKTKQIKYSGEVKANGSLIQNINYKSYTGYVTQEDILIDTLTVKECLMFSARLKINATYKKIEAKVQALIHELMLDNCQNTYIGGVFVKGVSGGERKRTCIGIELITEPSVLFLDEPTSGLDSFTAATVIRLLVSQAHKKRTIITTIHQPNSESFALFDKLILMSDGHIVYQGRASECSDFFANAGFACPPLSNPADFFIETLHIKRPHELDETETATINKLLAASKKNQQKRNRSILGLQELESSKTGRKRNFFFQVWMNFTRFGLRVLRNPGLSVIKLFIMVFNSILLNIFYFNISHDDPKGFRNTNGAIYFITMSLTMSNVQNNILSFPLIRSLTIKEYNSNMYTVSALIIGKSLVDLINDFIFSLIFMNLTYWSVGLTTKDFYYILYFFGQTYFISLAGGSLGMFCGSLFKRTEVAMAFSSLILMPNLYFSGFYRNDNIPDAFRWLENLSVIKYGFQGLVRNQWEGVGNTEICFNAGNCKSALDQLGITMTIRSSMGYLVLIMVILRIITNTVLEIVVRKNKS